MLKDRLQGQEEATADLVSACENALALALRDNPSNETISSHAENSPVASVTEAVMAMGKLSSLDDRLNMLVAHGGLSALVHVGSSLAALKYDERLTEALAETMADFAKSQTKVTIGTLGSNAANDGKNDLTSLFTGDDDAVLQ